MSTSQDICSQRNEEISQEIRNGIYVLVPRTRKRTDGVLKSDVWRSWLSIVYANDKTRRIDGKIACVNCYETRDYTSESGTTNLECHLDKCLGRRPHKTISTLSTNQVVAVKKLVQDNVVKYVCKELRPFQSIECDGFLSLANAFIRIGHLYGNIEAQDILPSASRLGGIISEYATDLRKIRRDKFEKIETNGVAITADLWIECYTKQTYLNMNCHYVDEGTLCQNTMCCKVIDEDRITGENIKAEIEKVLDQFAINIANVTQYRRQNVRKTGAASCDQHVIDIVSLPR